MLDAIRTLLEENLSGEEFQTLENCKPEGFWVTPDSLVEVAELLHSHPICYFDHLASLSGVDNGVEENTLEVVYHLYSIPLNQHLTLKVKLDRENPKVESISSIWQGANWHEREAYDLFGIQFLNHPDLRRILLPTDWVGYPMRKDYQEDTSYHGMTIKHPDSNRQ